MSTQVHIKKYLIALFTLSWLCNIIIVAYAQDEETIGSISIPMKFNIIQTPAPIVHVSINGGNSVPFVVDTGATSTLIIFESAVSSMGLTLNQGSKQENGVIYKTTSIKSVEIVAFNEEDNKVTRRIKLPVAQADVVDFDFQESGGAGNAIGIIGFGILSAMPVCFDFAQQTLKFYPKQDKPLQIPNAITLPLIKHKTYASTALGTITGENIEFMIDTGCLGLSLTTLAAKQAGSLETGIQAQAITAAGNDIEDIVLLPSLSVGKRAEPILIASVSQKEKVSLLGMGLLSRFRMTLDVPNRQVHFEVASNYTAASRLIGISPVSVEQQGALFVVDYVIPGSAPHRLGVKIGDRLVSVDGVVPIALSFHAVQRVLQGLSGTEALLELERDGKRFTVRYPRVDISVMAKGLFAGSGFWMRPNEEGNILITEVTPNSAAEAAGVKVDDRVLELNGLDAGKVGIEQLRWEQKQPEGREIRLKVQRKGEDKPRQFRIKVRALPKPTQ